MNNNQNEKILQVTKTTLIVGIDVASEIHYARAFDNRGIEQAKVFKFTNDLEGFEVFANWLEAVKIRSGKKSIIIGMEPTGHYWFNLAQHLRASGIKIVLVNSFAVKRSKELDENNPTKNDRKDPKTIAMLLKDGRYMEPYIPQGVYAEMRTAMNSRWQISKSLNRIRNQIDRWLRIYFPEFLQVFADWEGVAALIILREFKTPEKILENTVSEIVDRWKKDKVRAVGKKRAEALVLAAKTSTGIKEGLVAAELELDIVLEDYSQKMRQYNAVMQLVQELLAA